MELCKHWRLYPHAALAFRHLGLLSHALWLIVRSLLGSIPLSRERTLPLALSRIIIQIALFIFLSRNLLLLISAALILEAAIFILRPERSTLILMVAGSYLRPICEFLPMTAGA